MDQTAGRQQHWFGSKFFVELVVWDGLECPGRIIHIEAASTLAISFTPFCSNL
ncbi:hypothetical protein Mapa_010561 [Marchantia paleacea]|nr:hypothetical protein Mapa_010561 [Marchantia paleacea]